MINRIWTGRKGQMSYLIDKHFGSIMSKRFFCRYDADVFLKGEDETVWDKVRKDQQNLHVYFDFTEILDIPYSVPQSFFEIFLLKGFRDAIKSDLISVEKKQEVTDTSSVIKAKKKIQEKKKKAIIDSYKFANDNKFNLDNIVRKLPNGQKIKKFILS